MVSPHGKLRELDIYTDPSLGWADVDVMISTSAISTYGKVIKLVIVHLQNFIHAFHSSKEFVDVKFWIIYTGYTKGQECDFQNWKKFKNEYFEKANLKRLKILTKFANIFCIINSF